MFLFRYFLFTLLLALTNHIVGQNVNAPTFRNNLTLTVGLNHGYFKDQNFSPLNYQSPGTRFGLAFTRNTATGHQWSTELGVSLNSLKNPTNYQINPDRYQVDIAFGYLRALSSNDDKRHLRLRNCGYWNLANRRSPPFQSLSIRASFWPALSPALHWLG